jgi:hypothetical protein
MSPVMGDGEHAPITKIGEIPSPERYGGTVNLLAVYIAKACLFFNFIFIIFLRFL